MVKQQNNIESIRQGFTQFIASIIEQNSSNSNDIRKIKHLSVAIILEEVLKIVDNDYFVAKPIFKAMFYLLSTKINDLTYMYRNSLDPAVQSALSKEISHYNNLNKNLNKLIESIKE